MNVFSPYESPSFPCCYSSMIYYTNVIVAYWYGYYLYSALFAAILITSLFHHSTKTHIAYWIDQIFVITVSIYSVYILFDKIAQGIKNILYYAIIAGTFLGTMVLYFYGNINNCFCFAKDSNESDRWHQLLHFTSSILHNFIVIL